MKEKIAITLLSPINPFFIIILGIYTVVWGLWLVNPFWSVFWTAPLYSAMASIAPEYIWGAVAIISGLVTIRGATKPSYSNVQKGAFVSFFHWLIVSIMYFIGDFASTGGISALTFSIYSAMVWANVKINRKRYDFMK